MSMVERLETAIEEAARKSVPWPENLEWKTDENGVDVWYPQTLEEFVSKTYLGEKGADIAFQAAAKAAARAVLTALMEPSEGMVRAGSEASSYHGLDPAMVAAEVGGTWKAMLSAALEEG